MHTYVLVFSVIFPLNVSSVWMEFNSKETCEKAGMHWYEKMQFEINLGRRIEWSCLEK